MKLTPLEIRKQEFKKTLRGFDPIEVRTFLEMVAEQFEKQLDEIKLLHNKLIELEAKLKNYQETEKDLRETLFNVQEVKKQSEESSRRQADLIVKEAELKSIEILENARKQARQIREEVGWLRSQKESFINRLRHILISQVELLSVLEIDDSLPQEMQKVLKSGKARKPFSLNQSSADQEITTERDKTSDKFSERPEIGSDPKDGSSDSEQHSDRDKDSSEKKTSGQKNDSDSGKNDLPERDINDYFKKGIRIDELIETLNKKDKDKKK